LRGAHGEDVVEQAGTTSFGGVRRLGRRKGLVALFGGIVAVSALALLGVLFALIGSAHADVSAAGALARIGLVGGILGGFGLWHQLRNVRRPGSQSGTLRVDEEALWLDGERLAPRASLRAGTLQMYPNAVTGLRLDRAADAGGPIELAMPTVEAGRAALHALGLDASKSTAKYGIAAIERGDWRRRWLQAVVGVPALFIGSGVAMGALGRALPAAPGGLFAALVALAFAAWATLMLRMFIPGNATVGADGVHLRWVRTQRFFPIADLAAASVVEGEPTGNMTPICVRLHLRSGATHDVLIGMARASWGRWGMFNDALRARAASLVERIAEVLAERRAGEAAPAFDAAVLARGERPVDEWVAALRTLTERADTFRESVTATTEALKRLVADASADAVSRAAAAVALSKGDAHARVRIAEIAEGTAAPRLRVALSAAATEDEAALREAMAELEEEERQREARG
jgi:hypothetical protein